MTQLKGWEQVRTETLAKWRELRGMLGKVDRKEFLKEASTQCSLCEKAAAVAQSLGKTVKCEFCAAFLAYGGCQPIIRRMAEASLDGDWETLASEVDGVIELLESATDEDFAKLEGILDRVMEGEEVLPPEDS